MSQAEGDRVEERPDPIDAETLEAIAAEATAGPAPEADDATRAGDGPAETLAARAGRLGLGVPARLRLFQEACRLLHREHARGRIFGDLGPGRLGALGSGVPVLLPPDPDAGPGELGVGTSPEQVLGEPATTAADVYALGVVLYDLLAGVPPIAADPSDPAATALAISERAPERPSRAAPRGCRSAIGGDLDAIVLEALRKEPERRYASAAALADDLDAHLAGLPVRAGRTSEWGRVVRFARRRKAVAAIALAGLAAAAGWGAWQVREARTLRRQAARAERATAAAREAVAKAVDRLADDAGGASADPTSLRRDLLAGARSYYEEAGKVADASAGGGAEVADALGRIATIDLALGRRDQAASEFRAAIDRLRRLGEDAPGLAEARAGLGRALDPGTKAPEARAALEALDAARDGYERALAAARPEDLDLRRRLARVQLDRALILRRLGDYPKALAAARPAVELLEGLNLAEPGRLETRLELSAAFGLLARILSVREDGLPAAAIALDRAVSILDATPGPDKDSPRVAFDTASRLVDTAELHHEAGEAATAVDALGRASKILEGLVARHPGVAEYRAELASACSLDAEMLHGRGLRAEALARVERARDLLERLIVDRPEEARHVAALAFARQLRGRLLAQEGRNAEALKSFQGAADLLEGLKGREPADAYALASNLSLALTLIGVKDGGRPIEEVEAPSLPPADRLRRDAYARRAVDALRQAVAGGVDSYEVYRRDPALNPLRPREDFKKLLAELAAKQGPEAVSP